MLDFLFTAPLLFIVLPFALGAVTEGGVLGKAKGKVGNVVFSEWKGKNTIRAHVEPANPQTQAQQDNRSQFGYLAEVASALNAGLLQPFWDPLEDGESGFNTFVKENMANIGAVPDPEAIELSPGSAAAPSINSAVRDGDLVTIDTTASPDTKYDGDIHVILRNNAGREMTYLGSVPVGNGESLTHHMLGQIQNLGDWSLVAFQEDPDATLDYERVTATSSSSMTAA